MKVTLQCPMCDDGVLTATVDPDSILDLEDDGCGHSSSPKLQDTYYFRSLADDIWKAVGEKAYDLYLDAQDSRFSAWRDR